MKVALINKDLKRAARVEIRAGRDFRSLPALEATLGSAAVDSFGHWLPHPVKTLPWRSDSVVEVPAASAVIVQLLQ